MMVSYLNASAVRAALKTFQSRAASIGSESPTWDRVLTVKDHEGALDPLRPVVIGDRGTGKSFWTAALQDRTQLVQLAEVYPKLGLENLDVALGFGGDEFRSEHPTGSELHSLLSQGFSAEAIWRTVVLSLSPDQFHPSDLPGGSWQEKVQWLVSSPAMQRDAFRALDQKLQLAGRRYLITFDGLDTLAQSWADINVLMHGILQVGLFLRSSRNIKLKLFLRPDMADEPTLWAIGDSSKLRHYETFLSWTRKDLHGLVIQSLANANETSEIINEYCRRTLKIPLITEAGRKQVPDALMSNEAAQQRFFICLAGEYMGKTAQKGRTYTWVPNHLANARGNAAPRSFLIALAIAADNSKTGDRPLEIAGIQEGVRQASALRMRELREDYRWIDAIFRPLRNMIVPVDREEVLTRWSQGSVVQQIFKEMDGDKSGRYLPPPRTNRPIDDNNSHLALLETLDHLGIIETTGDERLNMPDLFRLAAGVKRRGGVKLRP